MPNYTFSTGVYLVLPLNIGSKYSINLIVAPFLSTIIIIIIVIKLTTKSKVILNY
jgi:hypothetical protein